MLDTPRESDFDDLVKLAAEICHAPISLVSLVDRDRQWFKGRYGLEISETPRNVSFCSHTIRKPSEMMVVPDADRDERFRENKLVTGAPFIKFYAGVPLVTPEGEALGTLCVIDRTARELSEEQREALRILSRQVMTQLELRRRLEELETASATLEESNAELEGFSYAISHDVRAPLRSVIGFAGLLSKRFGDRFDEVGRELLGRIEQSSKSAVQVLEDFTRLLQLRNKPLKFAVLEMEQLVSETVEMLKPLSPMAEFKIGVLPKAHGDSGLVKQALANLLSNAVKFSQKRTTPLIEIMGWRKGEWSSYSIRDNGVGFDSAHAERLWNPFSRLHGSDFEGTGLGLTIVRRIVQKHGGSCWAEAQPDEGATFYFTLPAA